MPNTSTQFYWNAYIANGRATSRIAEAAGLDPSSLILRLL